MFVDSSMHYVHNCFIREECGFACVRTLIQFGVLETVNMSEL